MDIQNLIRDKVIGNIKIGTKAQNGLPKKLSYFNVEEDKGTKPEMVEIFKQLYPGEPTKLKIRFTNEDPFRFRYKRYVNNKVVCIGNDAKAITIGKDAKNKNTQIEIDCNEECQHRKCGKCKLKGSLKFKLDGIEAGGVWNISTTGGISLSNIASEIVKYKKANMSIVDVPFELSLTEQESLAYGTYYSIDLNRTDIKPHIVKDTIPSSTIIQSDNQEPKQLAEENQELQKKEKLKSKSTNKNDPKVVETPTTENASTENFSNYLVIKKRMPTMIGGRKFDKFIFEDANSQDVEYILHPRANQDIMKYGIGTVIELKESKIEVDRNILCKYEIKQVVDGDENLLNDEETELKKAV